MRNSVDLSLVALPVKLNNTDLRVQVVWNYRCLNQHALVARFAVAVSKVGTLGSNSMKVSFSC